MKSKILEKFKNKITFYQEILNDKRTPKLSKIFLSLAILYAINPIDIIPDFIPVLGFLDDLIIIPLLIFIAIKLIPKDLIKEYKQKTKI